MVYLLNESIEALVVAEFCRPDVGHRFLEPQPSPEQIAKDEAHLRHLKSELQVVRETSERKGRPRTPMMWVLELEASLGEEIEQVQERRLRQHAAPLPQSVQ